MSAWENGNGVNICKIPEFWIYFRVLQKKTTFLVALWERKPIWYPFLGNLPGDGENLCKIPEK